jgi:malonyl-CoA/methylmalonyl-CoA synthetase
VLNHAGRTPDARCIAFDGEWVTYAALRAKAESFANALLAWGLRPADRVALYLENSIDFLVAYLGTWWAGGTVVLVNTAYRHSELRHILGDSNARLCVVGGAVGCALRAELDRVRPDLPRLERALETGEDLNAFVHAPVASASAAARRMPDADMTAVIAYTSGTTGRSKGAMLRHRNLIANAQSVCEAWCWTGRDHLLLMLPLFHTHGLMVGAHGTLVAGASLELHRKFDATAAYDRLLSGDFSLFFGVPTMYTRLIAEARSRSVPPKPLRLYVSGSAALSPHTFAEFESLFGQQILERYGMTETIMNMTNPYASERRPGTVGMPFPRQQGRVVDLHTRQPVPPETVGEIEVRGPHVFAGYLNQPEATAESIEADGWFRTGDLGQVSADGYYTITGRATELIITGGYNVYPREVEDVLVQCPGVAEAAVFGLPDAEFGECVCAALVRTDVTSTGVTTEAVIAFCKEQLASYKKPRHIFFVAELPRNAMGKVQKLTLAAHVQAS